MAEQVNQRIELMINELEQLRRTELYSDEELKGISRKRKEYEYHIQRRVKHKEDYVQYITYELALLEDIALRRKKAKLTEKRKDIEYAIAKRLNKLFKQFIQRFQNDIQIYFEYIKFCKSVGFIHSVSGIISEMLLIHGDKPKTWQLASIWESEQLNNLDNARTYLLKGIQRHPNAETLYVELFKIELLTLMFNCETDEDKEKQTKRADVVWRNGIKNVNNVNFLFKLFDLCLKYNVEGEITKSIKEEIWTRRDEKETWVYIAGKELEGCHWNEIEDLVDEDGRFSKEINNYIGVFEEALQQFPDQNLCTKYIHNLLGADETICSDEQKIKAVKHAWMYGHESGLLTEDMYAFGIQILKIEGDMTKEEMLQLLDAATEKNSQVKCVWEEKILLQKPDEKKMMSVLQEATKALKSNDAVYLYNVMIDNLQSEASLKTLYKKFQSCENSVLLSIKPKLLQKIYDHNGLKATRDLYEDLIRTPPIQLEVNQVMIAIEKSQEKPNVKNIRRCYEIAVQNHGSSNIDLWMDYMKFETDIGDITMAPLVYRRAVAGLNKELVDEFIKVQTLAKLK